MKIIIGSDHRGYDLKKFIQEHIKTPEIEWIDAGTENGQERVDYPIFTKRVCEKILDRTADRGIVICGSGIGVSIAANRFSGIYAALCWSPEVARAARKHDNANVLALSAEFTSQEMVIEIVKTWVETEFSGGIYQKRLEMLEI